MRTGVPGSSSASEGRCRWSMCRCEIATASSRAGGCGTRPARRCRCIRAPVSSGSVRIRARSSMSTVAWPHQVTRMDVLPDSCLRRHTTNPRPAERLACELTPTRVITLPWERPSYGPRAMTRCRSTASAGMTSARSTAAPSSSRTSWPRGGGRPRRPPPRSRAIASSAQVLRSGGAPDATLGDGRRSSAGSGRSGELDSAAAGPVRGRLGGARARSSSGRPSSADEVG